MKEKNAMKAYLFHFISSSFSLIFILIPPLVLSLFFVNVSWKQCKNCKEKKNCEEKKNCAGKCVLKQIGNMAMCTMESMYDSYHVKSMHASSSPKHQRISFVETSNSLRGEYCQTNKEKIYKEK